MQKTNARENLLFFHDSSLRLQNDEFESDDLHKIVMSKLSINGQLAHNNHMDSYPTYLGKSVIMACRKYDRAQMLKCAESVKLVNDDASPTQAQLKKVWPYLGLPDDAFEEILKKSRLSKKDHGRLTWYNLVNEHQGRLDFWLEGCPFWIDYDGFQYGRSCEWAYIINLDTNELEIYTSHWRESSKDTSWRGYPILKPKGKYATEPDEDGDYGINLIATIPLDELKELPESAIDQYCERLKRWH